MYCRSKIIYALLFSALFMSACSHRDSKQEAVETKEYKPVSQELYDTIALMDSILFTALQQQDTVTAKTWSFIMTKEVCQTTSKIWRLLKLYLLKQMD